ncbi:MAG: energy-coupling factor transporter transmembrane protein EcfT [Oscillospiraceae bacterium]|nr:energy-coupling factor transporter transmembrane protein EcfT [Oscillospiraceae bacterium]
MIKDITIGQYFPGHSPVHRMDPRMKLILTIFYIVILFVVSNPFGFIPAVLFLGFAYGVSKIPIKMIAKSIKPILPIIIFTGVLNLLFIDGENVLFAAGPIHITVQGIYTSLKMALRLVLLIAGTSLMTYTTSPISLTDAIEQLLSPLKKVHFPAHELAMMMSIALRFIPTLVEETDKIMSAQKARGADMESGGLIQRAKALIPIMIPLFISAFRRAEELALAMECRCYHGGEGRTRMKQLRYTGVDFAALGVVTGLLLVIILLNIVPMPFLDWLM